MWPILTDQVAWSVGLSVTLLSPAKTAAPIELPFGLRTWVGLGNHVLDGGPDPLMGRGKFLGENVRPIVKYRDTVLSGMSGHALPPQNCPIPKGICTRI